MWPQWQSLRHLMLVWTPEESPQTEYDTWSSAGRELGIFFKWKRPTLLVLGSRLFR